MLPTLLEATSSLFFPKICPSCDELLPPTDRQGVCQACASSLLQIQAPFCKLCGRTALTRENRCGQCNDLRPSYDAAFSALLYEGKTRELLQTFKYQGQKSLASFFSQKLMEFIHRHLDRAQIHDVVSVPMEAGQQNERGFNQAALLSKAVAKQLQKPDRSRFLIKKKSRQHQSLLNKRERTLNIEGSFAARANHPFLGKKILLIDDILTTGSTASECAKVLKSAGAVSVTVLTVARGL